MMMKHIIAGLVLALVFFTVAPQAHAQDETMQFAANVGTGAPCGAYPTTCTGPTNIGGTFWIDIQPTVGSTGALLMNGVADLGTSLATVTHVGAAYVYNLKVIAGTYSSITVSYTGTTTDGTNSTYTGTATFNFTWYLYKVWRPRLTGATFAVKNN
jgi:hypothetical protein